VPRVRGGLGDRARDGLAPGAVVLRALGPVRRAHRVADVHGDIRPRHRIRDPFLRRVLRSRRLGAVPGARCAARGDRVRRVRARGRDPSAVSAAGEEAAGGCRGPSAREEGTRMRETQPTAPYTMLLPPGWVRLRMDGAVDDTFAAMVEDVVRRAPAERRVALRAMLTSSVRDSLALA